VRTEARATAVSRVDRRAFGARYAAVVELGDGWLAVPKSYANFHDTNELLARAAKNAGRDPRSVPVMIGTLYAPSVDASLATSRNIRRLGMTLHCARAVLGAGPQRLLATMEEFARKANM